MKNNVKNRFKQADKEALITVILYLVFFVWWYVFAYGLGSKPASEYSYILGFPAWFFYSCILGYLIISFLLWFVVKKFFVDIPLDDNELENDKNKDE